ncbi:hypothetical protein A2U01_0014349, partial [Trifolium medium]|nr:hypothetical protein [Trifolium medium]
RTTEEKPQEKIQIRPCNPLYCVLAGTYEDEGSMFMIFGLKDVPVSFKF